MPRHNARYNGFLPDLDWTAPATDLHDELVEFWFGERDQPDYEANINKANEWASEIIARNAQ